MAVDRPSFADLTGVDEPSPTPSASTPPAASRWPMSPAARASRARPCRGSSTRVPASSPRRAPASRRRWPSSATGRIARRGRCAPGAPRRSDSSSRRSRPWATRACCRRWRMPRTPRGYALTVVTLGADGGVAAAFERLREQGVDGVVVLNEASALARGRARAARPRARRGRCADRSAQPRRRTTSCSPTTPAARGRPPPICSRSATAPCTCSPVPSRPSRPPSASAAGGSPSRMPERPRRRSSGATGPRHPVTRRPPASPPTPR